VVVVRLLSLILLALVLVSKSFAQDPAANVIGTGGLPIVDKELEVAMGIDVIEKVDFDFNPKMTIGNENLLRLQLVPQKREIIFKGLKPGKTTVMIRDNLGDVRLKYVVVITATGNSSIVAELRELIGDVEGLEIGIKGGKVYVGGEIVVPDEIGRVSQVLANYPNVLTIIELSPQTQRVIARKMSDELARNGLKDVSVRIVNKVFWLEGVVSSAKKKELAMTIASAYLPPRIATLSSKDSRYASAEKDQILNFLAINEAKEPAPVAKIVKVTAQFVELSKNYGKVFAFKWAPLMGQDGSRIQFGQTANGNVTSSSEGTLSATISNLFPKLNSAKTAGYARVIQSGMVITKDGVAASINRTTSTPYSIGTGDFAKAAKADIGLRLSFTPKILEQDKVELGQLNFNVSLGVGNDATITTSNDITTNIVIKSKESAAIGGVVQNQSVTDYDKSDPAPITATAGGGQVASPLFRLLRSKNYTTSKNQFVMFVTPEVIESASTGTEEIRKKFRRRE
jgi:pilus assembly protein CpaC